MVGVVGTAAGAIATWANVLAGRFALPPILAVFALNQLAVDEMNAERNGAQFNSFRHPSGYLSNRHRWSAPQCSIFENGFVEVAMMASRHRRLVIAWGITFHAVTRTSRTMKFGPLTESQAKPSPLLIQLSQAVPSRKATSRGTAE